VNYAHTHQLVNCFLDVLGSIHIIPQNPKTPKPQNPLEDSVELKKIYEMNSNIDSVCPLLQDYTEN